MSTKLLEWVSSPSISKNIYLTVSGCNVMKWVYVVMYLTVSSPTKLNLVMCMLVLMIGCHGLAIISWVGSHKATVMDWSYCHCLYCYGIAVMWIGCHDYVKSYYHIFDLFQLSV